MNTKNKITLSQKKVQSKIELAKIAREAKKERFIRLS